METTLIPLRVFSPWMKKLEEAPLCCHVPQTCQLPLGSPAEGLGDLKDRREQGPTRSSWRSQPSEAKGWRVTPRPPAVSTMQARGDQPGPGGMLVETGSGGHRKVGGTGDLRWGQQTVPGRAI